VQGHGGRIEINWGEQDMEAIDLPPGRRAVCLKWVYKAKKDETGHIIRHKEWLVMKGYVQHQGVDFEEVFAPVTRLECRCG
jgi:hypothetical protein